MDPRELFVLSVVVYAALPLLIALVGDRIRSVLLYAHTASVLTLGGILGAVYVLPLAGSGDDTIALFAGQVAYGGFMFSTLVTTVVGRDLRVVRNIIALVLGVNILVYIVFRITAAALDDPELALTAMPPSVFDTSVETVALGGALIVLELLLLLTVLEVAKARLDGRGMVPVYVVGYVLVLVLDGVLFPAVVIRPDDDLLGLVGRQVLAKLVLAVAFAVPLLVFVLAYRPTLRRFEHEPLGLRRLVSISRAELLERVTEQEARLVDQQQRLVDSTAKEARANATVTRILDAATSTILVATDHDLVITHVNAGATRLLGVEVDDVRGRSAAVLHTEEEVRRQADGLGCAASYDAVLRAMVERGGPRDWEFVVAADERLMVSLSITPITSEGHDVGYVIAGVDITGRLQAEQARETALANEQESLARLREADTVKRTLVSTVSHELRTPISSILGYTELISEGGYGDLDPGLAAAVDRVRRNTERLARLTGDLLTLDRVESGLLTLELEPLDLRDVVRACDDNLEDLVRGRDITLRIELPDVAVPVVGNTPGLQRVVGNLVGNAVKFTPDPGTVTVCLDPGGPHEHARLIVEDTGIGVADADRARLFERFYRAEEAASRAIPGSGLGLAIVRAVVHEHGGVVEVESTPGEGTRVTVLLPMGQPLDHADPATPAHADRAVGT